MGENASLKSSRVDCCSENGDEGEADAEVEPDVDVDVEQCSDLEDHVDDCNDDVKVKTERNHGIKERASGSSGNNNNNNVSNGGNAGNAVKTKKKKEEKVRIMKAKCNCQELLSVDCFLETKELWDKFNELGTEMIITKTGR